MRCQTRDTEIHTLKATINFHSFKSQGEFEDPAAATASERDKGESRGNRDPSAVMINERINGRRDRGRESSQRVYRDQVACMGTTTTLGVAVSVRARVHGLPVHG